MQLYPLMLKACRLPALWRAFQHISFREGYKMGFQTLADVLNQTTRKSIVVAAQREASEATFFHGRTGKEFVRVPSGHFFFGTEKTMPTYLGAFWIAKTLVTNAEYAQFLNELGANEMMKLRIQPPKHWRGMMPPLHLVDHPVVFVSWHEANEYAKWAGAELPTEHQWEKAARGWDGRKYPWGNYWTEGCCNSMESGINTTTSVGQYSPQGDSPYGCSDLVGNVWEWTRSKWQLDSPWIVRRGGSWHLSSLDLVVANARNNNAPFDKYESLGFRIILTNV
ncbi:MAG: SUMF1/EgtB/PvdO family nonheme iron enzyme [Ardenticatenaceae bacterium]|nr:SUMF1/EgtB/PvdO family nonheme iron enzyme [Ardenticatenaceae bacterium]MCB8946499.1 SUMF1/EgtB/PvdO family nonheme iron enzyme [Ardenticatenaceae bacterium]